VTLEDVRRAHPRWEIWESRYGRVLSGIFYATPLRRNRPRCPVTLTAPDTDQLDEQIRGQEDFWDGLTPAPPAGHLAGLIAF
jgi:hypothetical protein